MSKILLICTTSNTVITFRKTLIEALQAAGHKVSVIVFDEINKAEIENRGIEFHCIKGENRSVNPFSSLSLKSKYKKLIKSISPDIVFTFMMKPNIFGALGAVKAGVKEIFCMVEGAGDVFANNGVKWKLLRTAVCALYRKAFKYVLKVIFLNNDDKNEFISRKLVRPRQCEIVPGIGVDLERFVQKPIENHNTFLMLTRLIKTKGVIEYCDAARLVKQKYPQAKFYLVGGEGNIKASDIKQYTDDGSVEYCGHTKDVRPYLENCSVFVLPSYYREGLPMSIMEASAVGRAVITTDNVGCRDAVTDGFNGFTVDIKSASAIADKCVYFLENTDKIVEMGNNGRALAQQKFDKNVINEQIMRLIGA